MTLLEIREQFVRQSGRYDLVVDATSWQNNGADFYIQAGQRMLDRMLPFPKEEGELTISLATNQIASTLTDVRAVRRVSLQDSTEGTMKHLVKTSVAGLRDLYGAEVSSLSGVTSGPPIFWALGTLRGDVTTTTTSTEGSGLRLITVPPADRNYTLNIWVLLESNALTNDASYSFWSLEHPEVLVQAALYQVEVAYRNFEGSRTLMAEIEGAVLRISDDVVEQMLKDVEVLKDSHRFISDVRGRTTRHDL